MKHLELEVASQKKQNNTKCKKDLCEMFFPICHGLKIYGLKSQYLSFPKFNPFFPFPYYLSFFVLATFQG